MTMNEWRTMLVKSNERAEEVRSPVQPPTAKSRKVMEADATAE